MQIVNVASFLNLIISLLTVQVKSNNCTLLNRQYCPNARNNYTHKKEIFTIMVRQLNIGEKIIDGLSEPYVIAEIGHNHQGNLEKCKKLFFAAKQCGVDAVKLQKRTNKLLYTKELYYSKYDNPNSYGDTYGEHREALEFGYDEFLELRRYSRELGLDFFCTAFDIPSVDFLEDIDIDGYKIASGDLEYIQLIKYAANTGKPILISTGGSTMEDVRRAYTAVRPITSNFSILQCTASYPAEPEDMNLRVIERYGEEFPDIIIGLSDHQNGIAMSLVAYMLGARIFEKHFTLNRGWKGTDQGFSLEPTGMTKMIRDLRRARVALGDGCKKPYCSEVKPLMKMGKQLVAAHDIHMGHIISASDIAIKSPKDNGLPPYEFENLLGLRTKKELCEDEPFTWDILMK